MNIVHCCGYLLQETSSWTERKCIYCKHKLAQVSRCLKWPLKPCFLPLLFSKYIFMGLSTVIFGGYRSMNEVKSLPSTSTEEKQRGREQMTTVKRLFGKEGPTQASDDSKHGVTGISLSSWRERYKSLEARAYL